MDLPIHPMLVHFPIAFYFLELVLLLMWRFKNDDLFSGFAVFVFRAAFVTMIAALVSGWLDAGGWKNITGEVREHFLGGLSLAFIQLTRGIYWHFGKPYDARGRNVLIVTALIGCASVIYTAHAGGELVYKD